MYNLYIFIYLEDIKVGIHNEKYTIYIISTLEDTLFVKVVKLINCNNQSNIYANVWQIENFVEWWRDMKLFKVTIDQVLLSRQLQMLYYGKKQSVVVLSFRFRNESICWCWWCNICIYGFVKLCDFRLFSNVSWI